MLQAMLWVWEWGYVMVVVVRFTYNPLTKPWSI